MPGFNKKVPFVKMNAKAQNWNITLHEDKGFYTIFDDFGYCLSVSAVSAAIRDQHSIYPVLQDEKITYIRHQNDELNDETIHSEAVVECMLQCNEQESCTGFSVDNYLEDGEVIE